jgi:hypothetical protein
MSCKNNKLEDCKPYCVFKNALNSVKTPKKRVRPEFTTPLETNNPINPMLNPNRLSAAGSKKIDSDFDDCLSQYMVPQVKPEKPLTPSITSNPFAANKQKQELKNNNNNLNMSTTSSTKSSNISVSKMNNLNITSSAGSSIDNGLVFFNKKFLIVGFDDLEASELQQVLRQKGGAGHVQISSDFEMENSSSSLLSKNNNKNQYFDYSLYPLTLPAATSHNNPVTVFWMRKCIEQNELIPIDENIFNQPVPRFNSDKPLIDCVITISGFVQAEREMIAALCKTLGAHVQSSLSGTVKDDIKQNTHLICKQAAGPKYVAAKTWGLPVLCPEWLVETCVSGDKADEKKYSIENQSVHSKSLIEALAKIRRSEDIFTNSSYGGGVGGGTYQSNANSSRMNVEQLDNQNMPEMEVSKNNDMSMKDNHNDSSLSYYSTDSKKARLEPGGAEETKSNVTMNDSDLVQAAIENSIKMKINDQVQFRSNAANNAFQNQQQQPPQNDHFITPCNPRLKELKTPSITCNLIFLIYFA